MRITTAILMIFLGGTACSEEPPSSEEQVSSNKLHIRQIPGRESEIKLESVLLHHKVETDTESVLLVAKGEALNFEQLLSTRSEAIKILAYRKSPVVEEALLQIATNEEEHSSYRDEAFLSLAKLGNEVGLQWVRQQSQQGSTFTRLSLGNDLCDFDRSECISILLKALDNLEIAETKWLVSLVLSLKDQGVVAGFDQLQELSRSRDPKIRQHVLEGIVLYRRIANSQPEECHRVQELFLSLADTRDHELGALFLKFVPVFSGLTWEYETYREAVRELQEKGPEGYLETQVREALEKLDRLQENEPWRREQQGRKEEMIREVQRRQGETSEGEDVEEPEG